MNAETKLTKMLTIIVKALKKKNIPFCLIGAFALSFYGVARFTSDIDFLLSKHNWKQVLPILKRLDLGGALSDKERRGE